MNRLIVLLVIFVSLTAGAQDRVFTYTYQSGVLNKGQKEIEVWSTFSGGRANYYKAFNHNLEFELGLGGKLQTSFYLNYGYSTAISLVNGVQNLNNSTEYSFANEWKLKISDPVADRLGSALYFEYTVSPTVSAYEGKLILDKQIGNFVSAFNFVGEYENIHTFIPDGTKLRSETEGELSLELNYGLSYKLKKYFSLGIESMNQNQFKGSVWDNSILLLGPCFSYSTKGFWINLTFMPQITNLKSGQLELSDHERLQTRLIISYEF